MRMERRDGIRIALRLRYMKARGYTALWTAGGVSFEGPYRNLRLDRRVYLAVLGWIVGLRGYVLHYTPIGKPWFDGPYRYLKPEWRLWLALYSRHMRQRGFSMSYSAGGVYFEGALRSAEEIERVTWMDRLHGFFDRPSRVDQGAVR
jgi:hypothetical protein